MVYLILIMDFDNVKVFSILYEILSMITAMCVSFFDRF